MSSCTVRSDEVLISECDQRGSGREPVVRLRNLVAFERMSECDATRTVQGSLPGAIPRAHAAGDSLDTVGSIYLRVARKKRTISALNCSWNASRSKPGELVQTTGTAFNIRASQGGRKS